MLRLLAIVVALLGLWAPKAVAAEAPVPREPALNARFTRGSLPLFAVVAPGAVRVQVIVASRPIIDETGQITGAAPGAVRGFAERGAGGDFAWRLPATSLAAVRPGRYVWQAIADAADGTRAVSTPRRFDVVVPAAFSRRMAIPRTFGRRGSGRLEISTARRPEGVTASRFAFLASASARRWGLRAPGRTRAAVRRGDRRDTIGFGPLPSGAVGLTEQQIVRRVERRLRCAQGRCREVSRRFVGTVLLERDVTLNASLRWVAGPAYPELDEWDVETVLIHELGHAAGNRGHVEGCSSPLTTYGSPGDWWRTPRDRFRRDCIRVNTARAAAATALPPRFEHRTYVRTDVETVVVG